MGGTGIRWASLPGWGAPMILFAVPHNPVPLPTPGRFSGAVAPPAAGASGGGNLHLVKSMGGLVGAVGTRTSLLQAYQERSCLLRRPSLRTQATPLLPGSMTEGRLPCKHTWSPSGSRSGNSPIQLSSRAGRVEPQLRGSLHCPGWVAVPTVQRQRPGPSGPTRQIEVRQILWEASRWRYHQEGTSLQGVDLGQTELLQRSSEGTNVPFGTL